MTTPRASTGAEDLILKSIQALNRLGQNTAPLVPLVQTPTLATNQMCVQAPDTFNGMNLEDLWTFLLQCQITFKSCPQDFPTESSRVFFTISYLKKVALEWLNQGVLEEDPRRTPLWRGNWAEFSKELWTHFRPTNPTGPAEMELCHLTMAGNARLSKYLVHFNTLTSRVEWGEAALCFQFYNGLLDQLKDRIAILGKLDTLQELVLMAQHYDNLYCE